LDPELPVMYTHTCTHHTLVFNFALDIQRLCILGSGIPHKSNLLVFGFALDTRTRGVIYGGLGAVAPPQINRKKKKKEKKERKKEKRERKEKKREKRKKGTMNSVKLLHIKCCFFQFFNSPVALKNIKKFAPQEKVEMTPLVRWVCNLKYC
jgi:hypothetical protein